MFDHFRRMLSTAKKRISAEERDFITNLANSDIWILAIGVHGTPQMPSMTDVGSFPAALKILDPVRKELNELGDNDSVFPFNYRCDSRQVMPFFSSEEGANHFLQMSGFDCDLSVFQPFCLPAGFVATPFNDKFDLVLDIRTSSEHKLEDSERLLLRSLSAPQMTT